MSSPILIRCPISRSIATCAACPNPTLGSPRPCDHGSLHFNGVILVLVGDQCCFVRVRVCPSCFSWISYPSCPFSSFL